MPFYRPYIRKEVREEVERRAQKNAEGKFLDANTGHPIDGQYDLGHKAGHEHWRESAKAEAEGLTQEEFNERMNNPDLYQIEDPHENRSHTHEMPKTAEDDLQSLRREYEKLDDERCHLLDEGKGKSQEFRQIVQSMKRLEEKMDSAVNSEKMNFGGQRQEEQIGIRKR